MEKHSLGARRQGRSRSGRFRGAASLAFTALFAFGAAAASHATPYWIAWEGDDWPENQGWTRDILGGGDVRTLENGVMTLDGLDTGPGFVWDAYEWFRPGQMDPDPGETFVMQWRMRVETVSNGTWDPIVFVYSDESWAMSLHFATNRLWSSYEAGAVQFDFTPGVPHVYDVRSADMRFYELLIDGVLAGSGSFSRRISQSTIGWGDGHNSIYSKSSWDWFRFGVTVPESGSLLGALMLIATCVRRAG